MLHGSNGNRRRTHSVWTAAIVIAVCLLAMLGLSVGISATPLEELATLHDGRSRRETSTARLPNGDYDPNSNVAFGLCPGALY